MRHVYATRLLAGALFGFYMAHLLYLLNPQIELPLTKQIGVTVLYAVIGALLFGNLLMLLHLALRRWGRTSGEAPGAGLVVAITCIATLLFWFHLFAFRIYLPRSAVRALLSSTNLLGGTTFVLLLVWIFFKASTRARERWMPVAMFVVVAISAAFLYPRRDLYRVDEKEPVIADVGMPERRTPVVLLVIESLPHDWLITAAAEDAMPQLERISSEAFFSRLEPYPTTSDKALWASLVTGQLPYRHGVTGRYAYYTPISDRQPFIILPSGIGFRSWGLIPPLRRVAARLPSGESIAMWDCFRRVGLPATVIGWPGVATSFAPPPAVERIAAAARLLEARIQRLPRQEQTAIRSALQRDAASGARAVDTLETYPPAITAVWLGSVGETIRRIGIDGNELPQRGTDAGETIRAAMRLVDTIAGEIAAVRPDAAIAIVSPAGPRPPALPGNHVPVLEYISEFRDPGSDDGFLLFDGPGVKSAAGEGEGVRVIDVVPTLLFTAGLPVGRDMDGRVLTEAFSEEALAEHSLTLISTWEAERLLLRRGDGTVSPRR